jgi:hypothetical protein
MLLVLEGDMIRDDGQIYILAVYAPRALLRISALLALTARSKCVRCARVSPFLNLAIIVGILKAAA